MPAPRPAESIEPPTGQRPRLTNSRRFSLDYDMQTVGPEGVSAVELWGTTDGGRTWTKWGADPDKASPFDVEVNHEAIYGFRIVIVGKNGLATSTPQAGRRGRHLGRHRSDAAHGQAHRRGLWPGRSRRQARYPLAGRRHESGQPARSRCRSATAPTARSRPSPPACPTPGQYFWEYDPRSPRQIFLRLEVRDDAGNIAIDQLTEPIKVEGLEPKGQIRGFNPGPVSPRGPEPS